MAMFFNRASSFLPTKEQEAESAQIARRLGVEGVSVSDQFNPMIAAGQQMAQQVTAPPPQQRPGIGREIVGRIGDALSQWGGGQPIYGLQQEQQRKMEAFAAQQQAQRAAEFADWERKERWKRDNPEPINNDTVADYNFRLQTLGPEAANDWLRNGPDAIVTVQLPGNRVYSGPRSGLAAALSGGAAATASRPEVGAVVADPRKAGGPTPTASVGFRP